MDAHAHLALSPPSEWIRRFADRVPAGGAVLDVACGAGRHARWFAARGHPVDAVDRNAEAFADRPAGVHFVCADIEAGEPHVVWPFPGKRYAGVVVTNYLHRPLLPLLVESVAPGGILLYETFASGNERFGKPSNPDFLLRPGELLDAVAGRLRVVAFEDLQTDTPKPAMVQRIAAVR
jgi:SAM-dependent methyltransferase